MAVQQCLSTALLPRNLWQMSVLLMESYAMIQRSILIQPHRTVVESFVCLAATRRTLRFWGTLAENNCCTVMYFLVKRYVQYTILGKDICSPQCLPVATQDQVFRTEEIQYAKWQTHGYSHNLVFTVVQLYF